ncbi:MAG TPA: hypothetical protein VM536_14020 [Chloroflexia bacterium]|nr:hypothetical protein [Chloroflexia bacterium]
MHGLEVDLAGVAPVLRLDLFSPDGQAFFTRYQLGSVPAIVVFDPGGAERYRSTGRLPDAAAIKAAVQTSRGP